MSHPATSREAPSGWLGTLVDGTRAVVSGPVGDMVPGSAHGLYADGRRLLDRLELTVGTGSLVASGSETVGAQALYTMVSGGSEASPPLEVQRHRTLGVGPDTTHDALLTDRITLTSRAEHTVATWVRVVVGGDGLAVDTVRAGLVSGRGARADTRGATVAGRNLVVVLDDDRHRVGVSQQPAPLALSAHGGVGLLESDVILRPGEPTTLVVTVTAQQRQKPDFIAEPGASGVEWETVGIAADDHRLVTAVGHALDDLRHLLVRDPLDPGDVVALAGAPWDQTLDAREALWAARLTVPFGVDLALGTLRALARRQVHLPDSSGPAPAASAPTHASAPDVAEVTALWVCLLGEARLWGLADHRVRELLPTLRLAVTWIRGQLAAGFLVDPPLAHGPVVRLEVQSTAVEALRVAARIYDDLQVDGALELEAEAIALADRVRERFWSTSPGGRQLASALDAGGAPVDGDCSSLALTLGTGTLTAKESALVVDGLMDEVLLDPLGIRVRGSAQVRPDLTALVAWSLVRSGFVDEAASLAKALVEASEVFGHQWPEVFVGAAEGRAAQVVAGAARPTAVASAASAVVLQAVLGLTADAPAGWVRVHPPTTAPFGKVDVTGVRFQGHPFRVTLGAQGHVDVHGLPSDVDLVLPHGAGQQT
ncbi:MAG: hypothetical protein M3Y71_00570 [Actinomycetota bacterium]|nr:hypothetical protein [Actinomycetota bacterium]